MNTKKLALLIVIALLAIAFFAFDLGQYLTLGYLKSRQADFAALYAANRGSVLGVYFLIYVTATAMSLPGAAVLTLAGGALFGFWTGLLVISFASTIGATLACTAARFILRDWVQSRFGHRLDAINKGVQSEGPFYLFTVRLIPVIPFFVINLAMGLTAMPLRSFYWVSQLGMLPGTMVYVNAGKELGRVDSLSGILSPSLIASFVLLGLFPLVAKKIITRIRQRQGKSQDL
ncbi:TVP38/TMEM64 family protein [Desulfovibrio ferrophilus]|uniref:TVP38/TMEM64 family membrane protein n=1 Tax=Desulfovibrio ferrophilus TaxID=241368 RepID=A0A2Z6B291_9BACT|nr:TVP38/TMEM64 family protein [Desulfovibrio ferrophilus]BBD09637.1 SNARE associated Golgi protein [Desulfovibrio ferrophilus]